MIREAKVTDANDIHAILDYYISNTAINFFYSSPTITEVETSIKEKLERYPYIVLEENDELLGFAYLSSLKDREAYHHSAETTIYIKPNNEKKGYGKKLYAVLEALSKAMGIKNLYACIAYPKVNDEYLTDNSVKFHEALGYTDIGTFNNCGYKFNRYYDMKWLEKMIGLHDEPVTFTCYNKLSNDVKEEIYKMY